MEPCGDEAGGKTAGLASAEETSMTLLRKGNIDWRNREWRRAIEAYADMLWSQPLIGMSTAYLLETSRRKYLQARLQHLRGYPNDIHTMRAACEDSSGRCDLNYGSTTVKPESVLIIPAKLPDTMEWCWKQAARKPADCIILQGKSMPLVIIGLAYKLLWGAAVLVEESEASDDREANLSPISLDQLKLEMSGLPDPQDLLQIEWRRLALDLIKRFDGSIGRNEDLPLHNIAQKPRRAVDGAQLNSLEGVSRHMASPLMAARFWRWNQQMINWQELESHERDEKLVSIVIPSYGHPRELETCLSSLKNSRSQTKWETVVVMNDCTNANREVVQRHSRDDQRIRAVWPGENLQYALGCNLGFVATTGNVLLLLNNDCRVSDGWLDALVAPLIDKEVAATQPRLIKADGTVQSLGVVFNANQTLGYSLYAGVPATLPCVQRPHRLQALTGACLAMRAKDFARVRGLDCRYINSQEDIDLCLRLVRLPGRRYCLSCPDSVVVHGEGRAPGRYNHSIWSRNQFVRRWEQRISPDDVDIYTYDNVTLATFKLDRMEYQRSGIGAGRARFQHF